MQLRRIQIHCSAKQAKLVQSQQLIIKKRCAQKWKLAICLCKFASFFIFKNVEIIKKVKELFLYLWVIWPGAPRHSAATAVQLFLQYADTWQTDTPRYGTIGRNSAQQCAPHAVEAAYPYTATTEHLATFVPQTFVKLTSILMPIPPTETPPTWRCPGEWYEPILLTTECQISVRCTPVCRGRRRWYCNRPRSARYGTITRTITIFSLHISL